MNFYDSETDIRLPFYIYTDLSQHFRIYLMVFAVKYFIHWHGIKGDVKLFVLLN